MKPAAVALAVAIAAAAAGPAHAVRDRFGARWPTTRSETEATLPCTSPFGPRVVSGDSFRFEFNDGLDIAAPPGTPVYAIQAGTAQLADLSGVGEVRVYHGVFETRPLYSYYKNIAALNISGGDVVVAGQQLGVTGPGPFGESALHLEVSYGGLDRFNRRNPWEWLPFVDSATQHTAEVVRVGGDSRAPRNITLRATAPGPGPGTQLDINKIRLVARDREGEPVAGLAREVDFARRILTLGRLDDGSIDDPDFADAGAVVRPGRYDGVSAGQDEAYWDVDFYNVTLPPRTCTVVAQVEDLDGNVEEGEENEYFGSCICQPSQRGLPELESVAITATGDMAVVVTAYGGYESLDFVWEGAVDASKCPFTRERDTPTGCRDTYTMTAPLTDALDSCGFALPEPLARATFREATLVARTVLGAGDAAEGVPFIIRARFDEAELVVNDWTFGEFVSQLTVFPRDFDASSGRFRWTARTSVPEPLYLNEVSGSSADIPFEPGSFQVADAGNCVAVPQGDCPQSFGLSGTLSDICSFSGTVIVAFEVKCRPGVGGCNVPDGSRTTIEFDTSISNICPTVAEVPDIRGRAQVFATAAARDTGNSLTNSPFGVKVFGSYTAAVPEGDGAVVPTGIDVSDFWISSNGESVRPIDNGIVDLQLATSFDARFVNVVGSRIGSDLEFSLNDNSVFFSGRSLTTEVTVTLAGTATYLAPRELPNLTLSDAGDAGGRRRVTPQLVSEPGSTKIYGTATFVVARTEDQIPAPPVVDEDEDGPVGNSTAAAEATVLGISQGLMLMAVGATFVLILISTAIVYFGLKLHRGKVERDRYLRQSQSNASVPGQIAGITLNRQAAAAPAAAAVAAAPEPVPGLADNADDGPPGAV